MSIKSQMAAMMYLSKVRPKQYKLVRIKTYFALRERRLTPYGGFMWCNFHSLTLSRETIGLE